MNECGHDHGLGGHTIGEHAQHRENGGRLLAALAVILVFMVVEVIGGIISGSLALLADAAHMMTDAFALALAASAHWMSARPANRTLHFGYRRLQVIAAFVNGIALFALMAWIVYEAVRRAIHPVEVAWAPMLAVASVGLAANAIAFRLLHRAGETNINIRGAILHVASDLLGSVAAVIAAIVIWQTNWTRIDPILSIVVAVLIARSGYKLLRQTTHILLEGAPANIDVDALARSLETAAPGVRNIHDIKISQLTPEQVRLTLHARIGNAAEAETALKAIKRKLEVEYGIVDSTIQIEAGEDCPDDNADAGARDKTHGRHDDHIGHDKSHDNGHDHGNDHHHHDEPRRAPAGGPVRLRAVPAGGSSALNQNFKE